MNEKDSKEATGADGNQPEPSQVGPTNVGPKTSSDESSPIPPIGNEGKGTPPPPQAPPPETSEEHNPEAEPRWKKRGKRVASWAAQFFAQLVSILWTLALFDSYRPKITVTPGPSFDPKEPFSTVFIIQNQGALPIRNVSFDTTWTYADDPNQTRNVHTGLTEIPELKSLEQHAMIEPSIPPTENAATNGQQGTYGMLHQITVVPMPIEHHSIILWFDVKYIPKYWPKEQTEVLYFLGMWDSQTNFQWVPTGNTDFRIVNANPDLLKKALAIQRNIELELARQQTNTPPQATNSSPTNGQPRPLTNGNAGIHTN